MAAFTENIYFLCKNPKTHVLSHGHTQILCELGCLYQLLMCNDRTFCWPKNGQSQLYMVQRSLKLINIHYEQGSRKEKAFTFQNIYTLLGEKCHLLYLFCVPKVDLLFSWEYCVVRLNFFTIYYWENKIWLVQWFLRLTYGPCGRIMTFVQILQQLVHF